MVLSSFLTRDLKRKMATVTDNDNENENVNADDNDGENYNDTFKNNKLDLSLFINLLCLL